MDSLWFLATGKPDAASVPAITHSLNQSDSGSWKIKESKNKSNRNQCRRAGPSPTFPTAHWGADPTVHRFFVRPKQCQHGRFGLSLWECSSVAILTLGIGSLSSPWVPVPHLPTISHYSCSPELSVWTPAGEMSPNLLPHFWTLPRSCLNECAVSIQRTTSALQCRHKDQKERLLKPFSFRVLGRHNTLVCGVN